MPGECESWTLDWNMDSLLASLDFASRTHGISVGGTVCNVCMEFQLEGAEPSWGGNFPAQQRGAITIQWWTYKLLSEKLWGTMASPMGQGMDKLMHKKACKLSENV